MATVIDQTCEALKRYYESMGQGGRYDALFSSFANENGIEEAGDLDEELNQPDPSDSLVVDFDPEFPLPESQANLDEQERKGAILDIIKQCRDCPEKRWDIMSSIPKFGTELFQGIVKDDIEEIKLVYKTQCPVIFNKDMAKDGGLCLILEVGRRNGFDYLLNLVDAFDRYRVANMNKSGVQVSDWAKECKHFKAMKKQSVKITLPGKKVPTSFEQLASSAVFSFAKRACPGLSLKPIKLVNDNIVDILGYLDSALSCITNVVKTTKGVVPFQMDLAIAVGKPCERKSSEPEADAGVNGDDDDDDDDDEENAAVQKMIAEADEKTEPFLDYIGNIEEKLNNNKLPNVAFTGKPGDTLSDRSFQSLMEKLAEKSGSSGAELSKYLHSRRLISMIDRRLKKDNGKVYMYEPPQGPISLNIPERVVPEWFISSSTTCLLPPSTGYDEAIAVGNKSNAKKPPAHLSNIDCSSHCKGALLSFSFHVLAADAIKCYMYYHGQIIRYVPRETKDIFRCIFNMDYGQNKNAIESQEVEDMIQSIQSKLVDNQFEAFQQLC